MGPAGGGKSRIFQTLQHALQTTTNTVHKQVRLNPKAIRAAEMYGEVDALSAEWTTGVFAAMWTKYNNRNNSYNTWIIADGPVDAIWIEDLNTVLDDNKILTLANGDRIPMTDNVKLMFEVETLANASPATVSRAGIIFVSDIDLDWAPVVEAWVRQRPQQQGVALRRMFGRWMGENNPNSPGHIFDFLARNTKEVMSCSRVGRASSLFSILEGLLDGEGAHELAEDDSDSSELERLFVYAMMWTVGGLTEAEDRVKFDAYLRKLDPDSLVLPELEEGTTIFDYFVDDESGTWEQWTPMPWQYPDTEVLDFSKLCSCKINAFH